MASAKAPIPGPGEIVHTTLPDSFEGIRFEIGRMKQYIVEGRRDPTVISMAHKIAELAMGTARQLKRKATKDNKERIWLEGLHAWGYANFEHVSNPAHIELLKTPQYMLRELNIPEALSTAMWEPIRDGMALEDGKNPLSLKLPKPKITGNSALATTLVLALAAAVGLTPLAMRFGGHDGTLHYVWGRIRASGEEHDVDILLPKFRQHHRFEHYEDVEIPL